MSHERVASYRLQLHAGFTFDDAAGITGYLEELGITDLYLSPILHARRGSTHGYDVVAHDAINPELGGREGFDRLMATWDGGVTVDIVPNHMAVTDPANRWWWDVLQHGPASRYSEYFDIDWDPAEERLKRSILVPILGDHYGRVLEAGDIKLERRDGATLVSYFEHVFPLAPSTREHDVDAINADHDLLHEILEAQHYRLAYWRVAGRDLNYRRFFAINDLAALRIDRPEVFDDVHALILGLVDSGSVTGLRVDHIDGLRYPLDYLQRLEHRTGGAYVVVEKILESGEELREPWPVAGTTGYDFLPMVDGLFVDPRAEKPLTELYEAFTGSDADPHQMAIEAKMQVMNTELAADVERLTDLFVAVCEDQRRYRDFTRPELRQAMRETLVSFPVYRTYADARSGALEEPDLEIIDRAVADARDRRPDLDGELFDLLRAVLVLEIEGADESALAMRFQQASGPVMAKAIEDTLFYRYNRFVVLNEVGGDPMHFGTSIEEFHAYNAKTQRAWPQSMISTSTHDTKRSEDVRMRLAALSEIPERWSEAVERWSANNARHRTGDFPDRSTEYLLYQTLVGAWPLSQERATSYLDKAVKEAGVHTSWIDPNDHHDRQLHAFVTALYADPEFIDDLGRFAGTLVDAGYVSSLALTLIKLTAPGVPDIYQGTELWDFSLVDPDNRRPVDHGMRRSLLADIANLDARAIWDRRASGAPKLFLIQKALATRARHGDAFGPDGDYAPVASSGTHADHVVGFTRSGRVATVVPRLASSIDGDWADTTIDLPGARWSNVLTPETFEGGRVAVRALFDAFPAALLVREDER